MLFEKIKLSLRWDESDLDGDILDTIEAAISDLKLSGVAESKIVETDALILRAVKTFCKSEYAGDEKEAQRYRDSYEMLKSHLTLSAEYTEVISS